MTLVEAATPPVCVVRKHAVQSGGQKCAQQVTPRAHSIMAVCSKSLKDDPACKDTRRDHEVYFKKLQTKDTLDCLV